MTETRKVIAAAFSDGKLAEKAVEDLRNAGFAEDQLGVLTREGPKDPKTPATVLQDRAGDGTVTGVVAGGVVGTALGALALMLIPGLGPVMAGGFLLTLLGTGSMGALAGGLLGPFINMGMSEEEAKFYTDQFGSGRTVVVVRNVADHGPLSADRARDILHRWEGIFVNTPAAV